GTQPKVTPQHRSDSAPDLHRGSFAAKRNAAGQCCCRTEKFSEDGGQRNPPAPRKERGLRLRNPAAARIRKVSAEEITHPQRTRHWHKNSPPQTASDRIHTHSETFCQDDECHDRKSGQRSNDERQQQEDLALAARDLREPGRQRPAPPARFHAAFPPHLAFIFP